MILLVSHLIVAFGGQVADIGPNTARVLIAVTTAVVTISTGFGAVIIGQNRKLGSQLTDVKTQQAVHSAQNSDIQLRLSHIEQKGR